jgi:phosphatidylserine decarboxylase
MAKKNYPHPLIAREGWGFLGLSLLLMVGAFLLGWVWLGIFLTVIFVFILQFFRDPPRNLPNDPQSIVSPADGRVVAVERVQDPYTKEERVKISVFMNVFNVHSNRIPVDGVITQINYHPGRFLNAALDKASIENERNALLIKTVNGQTVTCIQIAGLVARRILCYANEGQRVARGERYGFIRFGSRVDLYLPTSVVIKIAIGQKVSATETILACWS